LFERYRSGGPLPWRKMVHIARAVCCSLEEAHGLGIVHRDLKPTNIHLEPAPDGGEDIVKVLDFGIAKILRDSSFDSSDLTNAGQMIGTLDYMSPEQMVGGQCTGQSDIYTLGILVYEMVAGRRPFDQAESPASTLAQMLKSAPVPLSKRIPVPGGLDAIVMKCLDREPLRRFPDVGALNAAFGRVLDEAFSDDTRTIPVETFDRTELKPRLPATDYDESSTKIRASGNAALPGALPDVRKSPVPGAVAPPSLAQPPRGLPAPFAGHGLPPVRGDEPTVPVTPPPGLGAGPPLGMPPGMNAGPSPGYPPPYPYDPRARTGPHLPGCTRARCRRRRDIRRATTWARSRCATRRCGGSSGIAVLVLGSLAGIVCATQL
jgi:serine/threonine-protein kinase